MSNLKLLAIDLETNRHQFVDPDDLSGAPGSTSSYRDVLAATSGQTVFTLARTPALPHLSALYINGVKATYGVAYTINAAVLTWLSSLRLEPTDAIEINYA